MGIGKRIKEQRDNLGLTQEQLADIIGVTKGAIANYENQVSHPKEQILYKLFDALQCDANFLFQDEMEEETKKEAPTTMGESYTKQEKQLMLAYRAASEDDKAVVDCALRKYRTEGRKSNNDFSEEIC